MTTNEPETIRYAAVRSEKFIAIGKCHADCFHKLESMNLWLPSKADDQGFMTSHGRFVNRAEAAKIAVSSKMRDKVVLGGLCSEDLWRKEDGGTYKYDKIKGYYKRVTNHSNLEQATWCELKEQRHREG